MRRASAITGSCEFTPMLVGRTLPSATKRPGTDHVSPVGFSSSIIPENFRLLYSLNPMVGVIDGFRWAITGAQTTIYWPGFPAPGRAYRLQYYFRF